ncbi:mpv17 / PMP22 family domain-containing protein [Phthorimaea operculella]|nr:mpv17 / PMP22 family domain-containing protein [Phthorimaea operculella]
MVSWHVLYGLPRKYPVLRGMISYGLTWPCCSLVQEYLEFGVKFSEADWGRAARFGIFGAFFMAPVFYGWMRFTEPLFPQRNLKTCLKRAVVEQLSYTPFALAYFLLGISLMELKTFEEANEDVKDKFWRAYTVGFVFWPTAQTVNYCLIPERNRIIFRPPGLEPGTVDHRSTALPTELRAPSYCINVSFKIIKTPSP